MDYVFYGGVALGCLFIGFIVIQGVRSTHQWVYGKLSFLEHHPLMRLLLAAVFSPLAYVVFLGGTVVLLPLVFLRALLIPNRKTKAGSVAQTPKKKRGPIGGSHTAEIMMFGEDPVTRRAARKVRDKFF